MQKIKTQLNKLMCVWNEKQCKSWWYVNKILPKFVVCSRYSINVGMECVCVVCLGEKYER